MKLSKKNKIIDRILIVGHGSIGKRHLRIAREFFPNGIIKVLRHQVKKDEPKIADGVFYNIKEAISFNPQIAIIANPAPFHIEVAQVLADCGTHLLIEKPLSTSIKGITKLIETIKKRDATLLIGYNLRYLESLEFFKKHLDKGLIGNILSVRCEMGKYLPSWRPESNYKEGVSARAELGGGALLELSHELDYLRWIFGEIDWVKSTLARQSSLEIDVEDTAHLTLGFASKSNGSRLIGSLNLDFIRHDHTRICAAIGDKGSLQWNALTDEIMLFNAGSNDWVRLSKFQSQRDHSYISEWKNLLKSIDGFEKPLISGNDGLKVLEIIEAAQKSSKSGRQEFIKG